MHASKEEEQANEKVHPSIYTNHHHRQLHQPKKRTVSSYHTLKCIHTFFGMQAITLHQKKKGKVALELFFSCLHTCSTLRVFYVLR